jgi:hypothetical protein
VYSIGVIVVIPMWFFLSDKGTPGAGDNLISSAMGVALAQHFASVPRLRHTRLVFASFDGEEICLKGSRAFFRRHKKEYHDVKTWNFNVDCPYFITELKFLTTDLNGFVRSSTRLAARLTSIARDLGYKANTKGMMFCVEAAAAGIEATTPLGMPYARFDERGRENVYHTPRDTIDAVDPEIVQATIEVFIRFVEQLENGQFP